MAITKTHVAMEKERLKGHQVGCITDLSAFPVKQNALLSYIL